MTLNSKKRWLVLPVGLFLTGCVYDYQTWGMDLTEQQKPILTASAPIPEPKPQEIAKPKTIEAAPNIPIPTATQKNDAAMAAWASSYSAYDKQATAYWNKVSELRKVRNQKRATDQPIVLTDYVLTQPPVYNGPSRPKTDKQTPAQKPNIPKMSSYIDACKKIYGFTPEHPRDEAEFMYAYADAAQNAGFTREQLVSIYAFETGGNGTHDLQSGMINSNANTQPISSAIGYNQLVATASVSLMWEYGKDIATELRKRGNTASTTDKTRLYNKAQIVDQMTTTAKTVPHKWNEQANLARTTAGMGIHAATLDKDIGPLLQLHKLRTSLRFVQKKGLKRQLTGAELEMLNLSGDGNGYDMVTIPVDMRDKVPTSNFFLRKGYERNPVVIRNNTVASLIKATEEKMITNMRNQGSQQLYNAFTR